MPFIIPEYQDKADTTRGYFTGNPNTVIFQKPEDDPNDKKDAAPTQVDKDPLADSEDEAEVSKMKHNRQKTRSLFQTNSQNLTGLHTS